LRTADDGNCAANAIVAEDIESQTNGGTITASPFEGVGLASLDGAWCLSEAQVLCRDCCEERARRNENGGKEAHLVVCFDVYRLIMTSIRGITMAACGIKERKQP
jgi:hypothetical protein